MVRRYRFAGRRSSVLRLTVERKRRGLSQSQLSRIADIHPATLSRLEAGKLFAYAGWRRRLERALGVSGDELFEEVDGLPTGKEASNGEARSEPDPVGMTQDDFRAYLGSHPTVSLWPFTGRALGYSRSLTFQLGRAGGIKVLRLGAHSCRVPSAWLSSQLYGGE